MYRADRLACLLLAAISLAGCTTRQVAPQVEVGHHRVRFVLPRGWEHLDHGRQQLFRLGEAEVALVDLGPATRDAMVRELRAAAELWRAGRPQDAMQHVRELRSPILRYTPSQRLAEFWRPWTDATYLPSAADRDAALAAFDRLIEEVGTLEEATPEQLLAYVHDATGTQRAREIASRDTRAVHGATWVDIVTWDRVSHMNRSRIAWLVNDGHLLAMSTRRGLYEQTGPAFEALLTSFEVTAAPTE